MSESDAEQECENYKQKYEKYKRQYYFLRQQIISKKCGYEPNEVNGPYSKLFYDLLETSRDILNLTSDTDFLILVGDTPSYLRPFLEDEGRTIFNLPFSNKPYHCFMSPHGNPHYTQAQLDNLDTDELNLYNSLLPTDYTLLPREDSRIPPFESRYFEYLNKNTILTKKFVKKNWHNLVLIDTSNGTGISGVSIFLNRYVNKIKRSQDCADIEGSDPLRFIRLSGAIEPSTNILPQYSKMLKNSANFSAINYNPALIILIDLVVFGSVTDFTIIEKYPRYVPEYSIVDWDNPPYDDNYEENYSDGLKLLITLKKMLREHKENLVN